MVHMKAIKYSHNNFTSLYLIHIAVSSAYKICCSWMLIFSPYLTRISPKVLRFIDHDWILDNNLRKRFFFLSRWCSCVGVEAATEKIRKKFFSHVFHGRWQSIENMRISSLNYPVDGNFVSFEFILSLKKHKGYWSFVLEFLTLFFFFWWNEHGVRYMEVYQWN